MKDSQSNPNRAAEVAKELIVSDKINLMLVASTPETTNPVSTTCESEGLPCISTVAPWQPWFIGQQGNPGDPKSWKPFGYAYHFFWGPEDVISVFTNMWSQLSTNKQVGGLFPNGGDGNAWGDAKVGFPPVFRSATSSAIRGRFARCARTLSCYSTSRMHMAPQLDSSRNGRTRIMSVYCIS